MLEVISFDNGRKSQDIRMYRRKRSDPSAKDETTHSPPPLFTVSDHPSNSCCHWNQHQSRLEETFQALLGKRHHLTLTKSSTIENQRNGHLLKHVESYLRSKLFEAFHNCSTVVVQFECHINCAVVQVGGFGGTWHHDATSQLTTDDGQVCDYLALCYLHKTSGKLGSHDDGHPEVVDNLDFPWLECALTTDDYVDSQVLCDSFCPISTTNGQLLVLRNDCMIHRTPPLFNLVSLFDTNGSTAQRRFFYIPFRALDCDNQPVLLEPLPSCARWEPYCERTIQEQILDQLKRLGLAERMNMWDYIVNGSITIEDGEETQSDDSALPPNWFFDGGDPEDS